MIRFRILLTMFICGMWYWRHCSSTLSPSSEDGSVSETFDRQYCEQTGSEYYCTDSIGVKINGDLEHVDYIAKSHGFVNTGQIGGLKGHYLFKKENGRVKRAIGAKLESHPSVEWAEPQIAKVRVKRDFIIEELETKAEAVSAVRPKRDVPKLPWPDPLYAKQWYLHGGAEGGFDMQVVEAWNLGYSGRNVVVSILDDGVQPNHPDLKDNFDPRASTDINGHDDDPTPQDNGDNKHGTRCAGEVAAIAGNDWCGVGIAYNSRIGGVRMLDGPVSDAVEGAALSLHQEYIDIYSASWGPEDDGRTVDGPGRLAKEAFLRGITEGRGGKGNIFIWASGNGGNFHDSCSCDGYTTSVYTLSVSSATFNNQRPWYLEECPSSFATTYSSANMNQPAIISTDMPNSCTESHTGTSASAPIAAGIVALTLEANRNLTWRDMQHLVARTANPTPLLKNDGWTTNGANRKVSNKFGYGMMDAGAMVVLAKSWHPLPPQHVCTYKFDMDRPIPLKGRFNLNFTLTVDGCSQGAAVVYLEHVQPIISIQFSKRGDLKLTLISPSNTRSVLLPARPNDVSRTGFQKWPFLSVQQWGENPNGQWMLIMENVGAEENYGEFRDWSLTLYGTETPAQPGDPVAVGVTPSEVSVSAETATVEEAKNETISTGQIFYDQCHQECKQVEGCYERNSATSCVKCQNFRLYLRNRSGVKCVPSCEIGFYTDEGARRCLACHSGCATCSGHNYCDTCPQGNFLIEVDPDNLHHGRCVTKCPGEFKQDLSDPNVPKCVTVCGEKCLECEGGTLCRRCKENYYLTADRRCVNSCGDAYFGDQTTRECVECGVNYCKSCSAVGICTECTVGYRWNGKSKVCEKAPPAHCGSDGKCASGSFCDKSSSFCLPCYPDCAECMGPSFDHCTKCKNHQLVDPRTRQCPSCKDRQYFDSDQNTCFPCPASCTLCVKPGRCVQCTPGYGVESGKCLHCCKPGEKKLNCASCPEPVAPIMPSRGLNLTKTVILLCVGGVVFFFIVFGLLMWKDRNYERDAKKYAYSKVPILYDIGDTQLVVEGGRKKRQENGVSVVHSDDDEDDFDTGADGDEETLFDKKIITNPS